MSGPVLVSKLTEARQMFHANLLASKVLHIRANGNANVSDGGNLMSRALGLSVLAALKAESWGEKVAPQTGGQKFEKAVEDFVSRGLGLLDVFGGRGFSISRRHRITDYHQYHPVAPDKVSPERFDALRQVYAGDYAVKPDVLVERRALTGRWP